MKTEKLLAILWLFIAVFFTACSDDDDPAPEDADDNFITSVIFTIDEKEYAAVIKDNDVTITVPYTISLNNAKVDFKYTSSATIQPDPATITDWDNERQFRVTSYNGESNDYKYLVVKADISEEGDVTLATKAAITALAEKGTTIINGSLTIGSDEEGAEVIESIEELSKLKEIKGDLIVKGSFQGTGLRGFENLASVGGVIIGSPENASTAFGPEALVSLPKVTAITGNIMVFDNNIEWVEFENLETVGGDIVIGSSVITSVTMPKVTSIGGSLKLSGINADGEAAGNIKELSLPALQTITGNIEVKAIASLETFRFDKLATAGAILLPEIGMEMETISLPELTTVEDDVTFVSSTGHIIGGVATNTKIREIVMNKIQTVKGTLKVRFLGELANIPGLSTLKTLGGLDIFYMYKLNTTLDISSIEWKDGQVRIESTAINKIVGPETADISLTLKSKVEFEGIKTLANLDYSFSHSGAYSLPFTSITGNLYINARNTNVFSMPELTGVGGHFIIDMNLLEVSFPKLTKVGGQLCVPIADEMNFPLLEEVGTATEVSYYYTDKSVGKEDYYFSFVVQAGYTPELILPALKKVGGRGLMVDVDAFGGETCTGISLPKLETVDGAIAIGGPYYAIWEPEWGANDSFTQLSMPLLKQAGSVHIMHCGGLKDFSAFANIISGITANDWKVTNCGYNPTFQDMVDGKYTAQ
mgnify:CR=1 FL=1